jgi:hypothetical protein
MPIVFSPVLRRQGGYGYDSFAPGRGVSSGPAYRRIEDAIYAQRVESGRDGILCRTLDEFLAFLSQPGMSPA